MRLDELNNAWEAAAAHPIAAEMTFAGDFLVLGAQTCLAKVGAGFDEARVGAVLAAAHGRAIGVLPLRHVRRAVETWRDGEKPLALIHLALSGLTKLANPTENARRLFFADALIAAGVDPSIIVKSLGFDAAPAPLDKYNPDQPRVAAGGSDGGQWTSGAFSGAPKAATTKKPIGVQVADAGDMRGNEVASDAAPEASADPPDGAASPAAGSNQAIELTRISIPTKPAPRSSRRIAKPESCEYFLGSILVARSESYRRPRMQETLQREWDASCSSVGNTGNNTKASVSCRRNCLKFSKRLRSGRSAFTSSETGTMG